MTMMEIKANHYPTLRLKLTNKHTLEIDITEPMFPIDVFGPEEKGHISLKEAKKFSENFTHAIENIEEIRHIHRQEIAKAEKAMLRRIKKLL